MRVHHSRWTTVVAVAISLIFVTTTGCTSGKSLVKLPSWPGSSWFGGKKDKPSSSSLSKHDLPAPPSVTIRPEPTSTASVGRVGSPRRAPAAGSVAGSGQYQRTPHSDDYLGRQASPTMTARSGADSPWTSNAKNAAPQKGHYSRTYTEKSNDRHTGERIADSRQGGDWNMDRGSERLPSRNDRFGRIDNRYSQTGAEAPYDRGPTTGSRFDRFESPAAYNADAEARRGAYRDDNDDLPSRISRDSLDAGRFPKTSTPRDDYRTDPVDRERRTDLPADTSRRAPWLPGSTANPGTLGDQPGTSAPSCHDADEGLDRRGSAGVMPATFDDSRTFSPGGSLSTRSSAGGSHYGYR